MNETLRSHLQRLVGLPSGPQLYRYTADICQFYKRMRDDPAVKPEVFREEVGDATCYPAVLKLARALDLNRDGRQGDDVRPAARLLGRRMGKDRYRILYRVGVGGMGEVYAASRVRASNKEDLVAVKTLKPIVASGEGMNTERIEMMVRRINQEASNLDQVADYQHVIKFIEDGYDHSASLIYIVTEFIDGRSLNELAFQRFPCASPPDRGRVADP